MRLGVHLFLICKGISRSYDFKHGGFTVNSNLISQITWQDYKSKIADRVIIIPTGSTEQHASHLPLGTDSILAETVAKKLAERCDVFVAPTVNYGYKSLPTSGGGPLFPGTIDLNAATYIYLIKDIIKELIIDGWDKILILNGHFENTPFLIEAADLLLRAQEEAFPRVIITDWYDHISQETIDSVFDEVDFPGWELEHAAIMETSAMLYLCPELVKYDRIIDESLDNLPVYYTFPPSKTLIPESGSLHTARSSSFEKGRLIIEDVVANLENLLQQKFSV